MTTVAELAERYEEFPQRLWAVVDLHSDATVVRNDVGNLAILAADGTYIGWIDVLTAKVEAP